MTLRPPITIGLTLAMCGLLLIASGRRLVDATTHARTARERLQTVQADLEELARLRALVARAQLGEPPGEDLLARVRAALDRAGVAPDRLQRLSRRGDSPVGHAGGQASAIYRTRSELLSLDRVTLSQVGRFLEEWRRTEPLWTVSMIDMTESRGRGAEPGSYTVQLTLTTTYVHTTPEPMS